MNISAAVHLINSLKEKFMTSSWHKDFRDRRKSWHGSNSEVKKKKKWQAKDLKFTFLFLINKMSD